jgi:hypothetical protein
MSAGALTQIEQRISNELSRRAFFGSCAVVPLVIAAAIVVGRELEKPKFHGGDFSTEFGDDFDVDRVETSIVPNKLTAVTTASGSHLELR